MKKFSLLIFLLLPSLILAQGKNKSHLTLAGGINFPLSELLVSTTKASYDAAIFWERTSGKHNVWGAGVYLANFKGKSGSEKTKGVFALSGYFKIQDNSARKDELQPFVKGGAGLSLLGLGEKGGHPNFPALTFAFDAGAGANYILADGNKIFLETGYRISPLENTTFSSFYLNLGISLLLK